MKISIYLVKMSIKLILKKICNGKTLLEEKLQNMQIQHQQISIENAKLRESLIRKEEIICDLEQKCNEIVKDSSIFQEKMRKNEKLLQTYN